MTIIERLKTYPGFVYQIGSKYYFLGKWICLPCDDVEVTDCLFMYDMCTSAGESENALGYFHKLRAYSDFALEIPYNPEQIKAKLAALIESIGEVELNSLEKQLLRFEEDMKRKSH